MYFYLTILLNFLVDVLLLMGANRLAGFPHAPLRCALAAGISGIYGGLCLKYSFLGMFLWHFLSLVLISAVAYGISIRRGVLFILLRLAVCGIASGSRGMGLLAAAAVVGLLCLLGFGGRAYGREYIPVELCYNGKKIRLLALRDTGNMLRDPITGEAVLVVDAQAGQTLLGLTLDQLEDPIGAVASASVPGLRLLPYRSVGQGGSMMLSMRFRQVKIGNRCCSALVAFAPEGFGTGEVYQALTGGVV